MAYGNNPENHRRMPVATASLIQTAAGRLTVAGMMLGKRTPGRAHHQLLTQDSLENRPTAPGGKPGFSPPFPWPALWEAS